jgi:hypothetical protein
MNSEREPLPMGVSKEKAVELMSEGYTRVAKIVSELWETSRNTLFDLDDMHMRGEQIWVAWWRHCKRNMSVLISEAKIRAPKMVACVNLICTDHTAREHGPQRTMSPTDFATKAALAAANRTEITQRADDGAEAVHNFFLLLLSTMQAEKKFTTNMRVNLGLESGHQAVFAITLTELLDKEGQPVKAPAQEEDQRIEEVAAQPSAADALRETAKAAAWCRCVSAFGPVLDCEVCGGSGRDPQKWADWILRTTPKANNETPI